MQKELKEIGLTENETMIYLALLKQNTSTPQELAERTGFSRSYIYDALNRMMEKQLVTEVIKKDKKQYSAIEPRKLEELMKQKLEVIQRVIPELEKLKADNLEDIKVEVHKGKYVYKTLLKDITLTLKKNEEVLIYGMDDETLQQLDPHYIVHLKQYFAKLNEYRITEKVIVKKDSKRIKEAKTTTYKFLPSKTIGNTAFEVYENKVAIFLWGDPPHLILITNKEVAASYRNQFKILWEKSSF